MTSRERTHAIVLAGGVGKRFWPVGRRVRPKQLLKMGGEKTLLEETCERLNPIIAPDRQWIATGEEWVEPILDTLGRDAPHPFLIEPVGRNTLPCTVYAALRLSKIRPDLVMAVLPADHRFSNETVFRRALDRAIKIADKSGDLIVFGVQPVRPETGYGYIEIDPLLADPQRGTAARRFVEKPDAETAKEYFSAGHYLWNSGMFVWRVDRFLEEARRWAPEIYAPLHSALPQLGTEDEQEAIDEIFGELPALSVDVGLLEKSQRVWCLPMKESGWTDLGSWTAVYEALPKDESGNVAEGVVIEIDSRNNLVINETAQAVAMVGLEDHMILVTKDAILVGRKENDQDVRRIVDKLSELGLNRLE